MGSIAAVVFFFCLQSPSFPHQLELGNISVRQGLSQDPAICMTAPFWDVWWFWGLGILAVVLILIFIYHRNLEAINRHNKLLSEIVAARTRELEEANRTKDKFFSIIAHDLRNPLNIFLGYSELLSEQLDSLSNEEIKSIVHDIKESSTMLSKLIENLLQWAKLQMGGLKTEPSAVNLRDVSDSVIYSMKFNAETKSIELENNLQPELFVFADVNMITTVFRNIINNAIKFTPRGGKVTVSARHENGSVAVTISDTGIGINTNDLERLFKTDRKFSTPGTEMEAGSGLGLILCKEFIERNSGRIWIESRKDSGTRVNFSLPLSSVKEEQLQLKV